VAGKKTPIASIELNDAERGTLASFLSIIQRAEEAKAMFRSTLMGIVTRAGGRMDQAGDWTLSSDLQRAEFKLKEAQNGNA